MVSGDDPVAVQTLAFAAHEILHRLNKNAGKSELIFDHKWVKPEHRSELNAMISAAATFFKHANRTKQPSDETVKFHTLANELFLMGATQAVRNLGHELNLYEAAFALWIAANDPSHPFMKVLREKGLDVHELAEIAALGRKAFFETFKRARYQHA